MTINNQKNLKQVWSEFKSLNPQNENPTLLIQSTTYDRQVVLFSEKLNMLCVAKLTDIQNSKPNYYPFTVLTTPNSFYNEYLKQFTTNDLFDLSLLNNLFLYFGLDSFKKSFPNSGLSKLESSDAFQNSSSKDLARFMYILYYRTFPYIEQLVKSGLDKIIIDVILSLESKEQLFRQAFKKGNNTARITNLKSDEWRYMSRHINSLSVWCDMYSLIKTYKPTIQTIKTILYLIDSQTDFSFETVKEMLNQRYDNQTLYTIDSLFDFYNSYMPEKVSYSTFCNLLNDYNWNRLMKNEKPFMNNPNAISAYSA